MDSSPRDGHDRRVVRRRHPRPDAEPVDPQTSIDKDPLFLGINALCDTAVRLTGVDGAALAVLAPSEGVRELVHATDAVAQQIDELQFTIGVGPCLDAYRHNAPQLCARVDGERRWPAFIADLSDLGVAAVFAYPVPGEHRPMGVLELYRRTEGHLGDVEQQSAQVCASALRSTLESNWHEHLLHSVDEEAAVDSAALRGSRIDPPDPFTRTQVHVAAGMISVQLDLSTRDALDRLRAYSFAQQRSIVAVAADVVARRLSFRHLDQGPRTDS